jgi:hypothetical protein
VRYAFIERHRDVWPVVVQCRVLEVSASGYRQHRARLTALAPIPVLHIPPGPAGGGRSIEEAVRNRIVVTVTTAAHRMFQIVSAQE